MDAPSTDLKTIALVSDDWGISDYVHRRDQRAPSSSGDAMSYIWSCGEQIKFYLIMDLYEIRVNGFFLIYEDGDSEEYKWPALKNVSCSILLTYVNNLSLKCMISLDVAVRK